ncbi:uncharacterized protein LOC133929047 [Phragmites australis]|uniref:uncharacterized protein LOC133929047 n=1 Tax=Phragmites australis TaxID=29695 RepID=UPI002D767F57|nr:uncharacterized protein LOC133929047 [Phragmites australis]
MTTKTCQAPAPAMPAVAGRATGGGGGNGRVPTGTLPPPRRGQIKEKIVKDVVAAVAAMAAGLVKNGRGGGGLPVSADANDK